MSYLPTQEIVKDILDKKSKYISAYAFIYHDKDTYDKDILDGDKVIHAQGELKQPHFHIYLKLKASRQEEEIRRWFMPKGVKDSNGLAFNCLSQKVKSAYGAIEYLTHRNAPEKYQYDDSEVISYNIDNILEDCPKDDSFNVIEDILNGVSTRDLVRRYGRDYIYHISAYEAVAQKIKAEEELNEFKEELNAFHGLQYVQETIKEV